MKKPKKNKQWYLDDELYRLTDKKPLHSVNDIQKYSCGNLIIKDVLE